MIKDIIISHAIAKQAICEGAGARIHWSQDAVILGYPKAVIRVTLLCIACKYITK